MLFPGISDEFCKLVNYLVSQMQRLTGVFFWWNPLYLTKSSSVCISGVIYPYTFLPYFPLIFRISNLKSGKRMKSMTIWLEIPAILTQTFVIYLFLSDGSIRRFWILTENSCFAKTHLGAYIKIKLKTLLGLTFLKLSLFPEDRRAATTELLPAAAKYPVTGTSRLPHWKHISMYTEDIS